MANSTCLGPFSDLSNFDTLAEETQIQLLFVNPFLGMNLLSPLNCIHALDAMNASVPHRLAATNMGATELTSRFQEHLNTQKKHRYANNSEGYE